MRIQIRQIATLTTLVIIFGSILPLPNTLGGEEARSVAHFIAYTLCSFSWARLLKSKRKYFALMIILTPLTEILQLPLYYRNSSIEDLIVNIAGVIVGSLTSYLPILT